MIDDSIFLCCWISTEAKIDKFMEFYRESFPEATVTPKLHMMEDHIVPFLQKWKIGLGFLGEQGAESIHARFNSIRWPNRVQRLECILKSISTKFVLTTLLGDHHQRKGPKNLHDRHFKLVSLPLLLILNI